MELQDSYSTRIKILITTKLSHLKNAFRQGILKIDIVV